MKSIHLDKNEKKMTFYDQMHQIIRKNEKNVKQIKTQIGKFDIENPFENETFQREITTSGYLHKAVGKIYKLVKFKEK